jgi:hypothetical protein
LGSQTYLGSSSAWRKLQWSPQRKHPWESWQCN